MAQDFTTTALLAAIRRRAMLPSASGSGTGDADLLLFATDELQGRMVDLILSVSEEHLVAYTDRALTSGTLSYRIPDRAVHMKLRDLYIVDSSGAVLDQLSRVDAGSIGDPGLGDFYLQGEHVILTEDPTGDYLRMVHYRRPSKLVATSAVATISAINSGTKTMTTAATIPGTFSTSVTFDLVRAKPGFGCLAIDQAATTASGTTVTFSDSLPSELAVGDYICLAGESPVPQIPVELHNLLAQGAAEKVLEARGDREGMAAAGAKRVEMEKAALASMENRVEGAPQKIVNFSPLFGAVRSWPWR